VGKPHLAGGDFLFSLGTVSISGTEIRFWSTCELPLPLLRSGRGFQEHDPAHAFLFLPPTNNIQIYIISWHCIGKNAIPNSGEFDTWQV